MTLLEMAEFICDKLTKSDETSLAQCKKFLQRRYDMICRQALWRDLQDLYEVSVPTGTTEIILPRHIDRVIAIRHGESTTLRPVELTNLFQVDNSIFERSGDPLKFSNLPQSAVAVSPAGELLSFVSSSTTDVNIQIRIRGMKDGEEFRESVTLNGTTTVQSLNLYDEVTILSKPTTAGTITIKKVASNIQIQKLWAEESDRKHNRIRLFETPRETKNLLMLIKINPQPLVNDSDVPILRGSESALIAAAQADMLERARQYAKADSKFAESGAHVQTMLNEDNAQSARAIQLIPHVQQFEEFD